jgi:beta-N-acetylhexosaminidase
LPSSFPTTAEAQENNSSQFDPALIESIFQAMTPVERVGQLFLVSFKGNVVDPDSVITELIQQYRIGGVYLSPENRNFANNAATPGLILTLTNSLQNLAQTAPAAAAGSLATPVVTATVLPSDSLPYTPIPLFIATNHEGDGYPYTQIRGGLLDVPNAMALGATWNPENARLVGEVVGQELAVLGINLLFGPSLDVLDTPRPDRGGSLGTRSFGGHPYWVGEFGQAYIRGIHQGGQGQVLTIAKHFPGFGSSDRPINQAIPTIPKSLDDLQAKDLLPFFKVTSMDSADLSGVTDGLLTAHVRYRGLQGSLPVSLDARNLATILALNEVAPWRERGGLMVSAPLGSPAALEGLVGSTRENFPARLLVQNAFLAGSDVLFLQDFAFEDDPVTAEVANIKNAIGFFQEKYANEPNFQAAVDKAVRRIIQAKIKIYGADMLAKSVQKPVDGLNLLGNLTLDLDRIAREGATLITSATQAVSNPLAGPPQRGDQILIFTDDRVVQDCMECLQIPLIRRTTLQAIMLQLFGPNATGQVSPDQITSLSFSDLKSIITNAPAASATGATPEPAPTDTPAVISGAKQRTESSLQAANWVIFVMLDVDPEAYPQSDAVKALLRNRYDILRNKNLILFSFNAPYFLDETEISQLTAYYSFYSKGPTYLETAARLLFQQFEPAGASPVGIPAIGPLDLSPDPRQIIQLEPIHKFDKNGAITPIAGQTPQLTTVDLKVGEGILFRTGVIMDKNGQPVPDDTIVNFYRYYPLEGLSLEPLTASTLRGVAEIPIVKERDTPLQVKASSDLASESITFNIGPGIVDTPTPTPTFTPFPTDTPMPTPTASISPTPSATPQPSATPTSIPAQTTGPPIRPVGSLDLAFSLLAALVIGGIAFTLGGERLWLEERVRSALVALAFGLVGYICYAILVMWPTRPAIFEVIATQGASGHWAPPLITLLFAIIGTIGWYLKPGRWQVVKPKPARLTSAQPDQEQSTGSLH